MKRLEGDGFQPPVGPSRRWVRPPGREDLRPAGKGRSLEGIGPLVIGADPARFGDDRFSLAWRRGRKVLKVESRRKVSAVEGANWIKQVIDADQPARVFIDLGGVGAGVFDILDSWGAPYDKVVVGVNFGGEPQDGFEYLSDGSKQPRPRNRRAEMWKRSRDWLNTPAGVDVPDLDTLHADAADPATAT